jgi:hypothetical protein
MYRWKIALLLPLALMLGGCVTYPTYTYRDGTPTRESTYVGDDSYYSPAYEDQGDYYSGGGYRYGSAGYRYYAPDYITYSAYYSLFWPVNRWYHDPYWHPGFYYGVTFFPRNYFSVSFHSGWRGSSYSRWSYGGGYSVGFGYSHWYSPYRYSWADSYYDWDRYRYRHYDTARGHGYRSPTYSQPRFGHARNQAERLAWQERERSAPRGTGIATGMGQRAPTGYGNARAPSRGADYGNRGEPRSAAVYEPSLPRGRPASTRQAWSEPDTYGRGERTIAPVEGRRGVAGRGADAEGIPLMRGADGERYERGRGSATRVYQDAPVYRERSVNSQRINAPVREYESAPAREPMRVREYSSEPRMPQRDYSPQQRYVPETPRSETRMDRGGRSADFGARSYSAPEPAPRFERSDSDSFRSAPMESRREEPAPRESESGGDDGGRRESRAREALPFD